MVPLDLAYIHYWMDLYGFRQFQLAGIVFNHLEYWEWSHILWFEGACLSGWEAVENINSHSHRHISSLQNLLVNLTSLSLMMALGSPD